MKAVTVISYNYTSHLSMPKIPLDFPFALHLMKDCSHCNPVL